MDDDIEKNNAQLIAKDNSVKRKYLADGVRRIDIKVKYAKTKGFISGWGSNKVYIFWLWIDVNKAYFSTQQGRIRGTLFIPPGSGPFPAVINIYGGHLKGSTVEVKPAVLASRGFVTLALSFFGVDDLPKSYLK